MSQYYNPNRCPGWNYDGKNLLFIQTYGDAGFAGTQVYNYDMISKESSLLYQVESRWKNPLAEIQDYGRIPAKCQEAGVAIFDLDPECIEKIQIGTKENIGKAKKDSYYRKPGQDVPKILFSGGVIIKPIKTIYPHNLSNFSTIYFHR